LNISYRHWLGQLTQPHLLFSGIALVFLAALWGAIYHVLSVERAGAQRETALLTRELVQTYEAQVVRAMRDIDQTLKIVKYMYEANRAPGLLKELKARGILLPDLLFEVRLADDDGNIIDGNRPMADANVGDEDYFTVHRDRMTDGLSIGQPPRGPTGEGKLHFSRRLDAPDGRFAGVVTVSVNADYFVSGYEESKLGKQGVLGIVGSNGLFRVRRSGDTILSGEPGDYAALLPSTDSVTESVGQTVNSWDGVTRYASARALYDFPVVVVVGLAEPERLAGVNGTRDKYLAGGLAASALVIAIMFALGRLTWQLARSRQRETEATAAHAQRVEYLAYHDALTNLPNRSLFSKLLTQGIQGAQRYNRRLAVFFIDLDGFKDINDTLGHNAGDRLLQEVAKRLKGSLRESDTVARLGGDEFVVMLPEFSADEDITAVAHKILHATAKPFTLLGHGVQVTASIGVSVYPDDGLDEQSLTMNADIAMYRAKDGGKNNFQRFSPGLGSRLPDFLGAAVEQEPGRGRGLREATWDSET
jgi:diguanylate cyclase (GGDEF)-like protein